MKHSPLLEVIALFLRLGATAFGGPAASIGLMHDEVVQRRKWLDDQTFMDLLGATNLIPGLNAAEMSAHICHRRAGWAGLVLGGISFILPTTLLTLLLAWVYSRYGSALRADWFLYGIKPVVIAVIVRALWELGRKTMKNRLAILLAGAALALHLLGVHELALLVGGGLLGTVWQIRKRLFQKKLPLLLPLLGAPGAAWLAASPVFNLAGMFLIFLKIGAVLYGSGYVLLAFLRADFVTRLGWLTDQQLLDAVAVGQMTPGPLASSATFIGYQLGGVHGALLATVGIFLPSFVMVALSIPWIAKISSAAWARALLDGVNAAVLGLMIAVAVQLGRASLVDLLTVLLALAAGLALFRTRIHPMWLMAAGALFGWLNSL